MGHVQVCLTGEVYENRERNLVVAKFASIAIPKEKTAFLSAPLGYTNPNPNWDAKTHHRK